MVSLFTAAIFGTLSWFQVGQETARWDTFLVLLCTVLATAVGVVILRMKTVARIHGEEIRKEREARVLAESVSRVRSEFLANMSHEIRTPLTGVVGIIELLSRTSLEPVQKDYLVDLATSSRALMGLLDQVLDAARIDAGKFDLEYADADPARLVRNTLAVFRSKAAQAGVELHSDIESTVPAKVVCDPMRLQQVLNNLVGNALKFTEAGSVHVRLAGGPRGDGRADLRFTVSDTGIGIPEKSLAAIFEPFTQAEGHSARKHGGTGLGLAICSKIIDLMGGDIICRNRPEGGAEFEFDLVLDVVEVTAPEADPDEFLTAAVDRHLEDVRILVAEDNPLNQKVIRLQLGALGLEPVMVANGREAIQAFRREAFDIVLMDCQMPVLDGYSATRAIRRMEGAGSHVPIIATTANAMPGDQEKCLEAGMDAFLAKPIKSTDLARALDQWLAVPVG